LLVIQTTDLGDYQELVENNRPLQAVATSPDGRFLAAGAQDGSVSIWRSADQALLYVLEGHPCDIRDLHFTEDSRFLLVGYCRGTRVWEIREEGFFVAQNFPVVSGQLHSSAYSPVGWLASAEGTGIFVRDIETGSIILQLGGHSERILDVALSPDGRHLASSATDQTLVIWELNRQADRLTAHHLGTFAADEWVNAIEFSPDGNILAGGTFDSSIHLWSIPELERLQLLRRTAQDQVLSLAFSPDGTYLAAGTVGGIRLWQYGRPSDAKPAATEFFGFTNSDQIQAPLPVYLSLQEGAITRYPSIESAVQDAEFNILIPTLDPDAFTMEAVFDFSDPESGLQAIGMTFIRTTSYQPARLVFLQSNLSPVEYDQPLGSSAQVNRIQLRDVPAEWVQGGWIDRFEPAFSTGGVNLLDRNWDSRSSSLSLRWKQDGYYYSLYYYQPYTREMIPISAQFTIADLILLGESLFDSSR
jgi:WD40 repeat protein